MRKHHTLVRLGSRNSITEPIVDTPNAESQTDQPESQKAKRNMRVTCRAYPVPRPCDTKDQEAHGQSAAKQRHDSRFTTVLSVFAQPLLGLWSRLFVH